MKPISSKMLHWIAILAILMGTFAPLVSQSMHLSKKVGSFDTEICSVDGVKIVHLSDDQSSKSKHQVNSEHCPYCMVEITYLPSLNNSLNFDLSQGHIPFPILFYQSPKPLFAWRSLPSRAPPTSV